jgi:hypothetical protein
MSSAAGTPAEGLSLKAVLRSLARPLVAGGALALAGYAVARHSGSKAVSRPSAPMGAAWIASSRDAVAAATAGRNRSVGLVAETRASDTSAGQAAALEELAARNPSRALTAALSEHDPQRREDWLHAALRGWAKEDPAAAVAWIAQLPRDEQEEAESAAMAGAVRHPETAVDLTLALIQADPPASRSDANHLLSALGEAGNYAEAVRFASSLAANLQPEMLSTAYQYWARSEPENAFADAARLPEGDARKTAIDGALSGWSQVDPAGLADYAQSLPPGRDRSQALETALAAQ